MNNPNTNKSTNSKPPKRKNSMNRNIIMNDPKNRDLLAKKDPSSTGTNMMLLSKHSLQPNPRNYFLNPTIKNIKKDLINLKLKGKLLNLKERPFWTNKELSSEISIRAKKQEKKSLPSTQES